MTKLLLETGANINESDVLGATPLHRAATQGRNNIVELILSRSDVKVDLCDSTGSTALYVIIYNSLHRYYTSSVASVFLFTINSKHLHRFSPVDSVIPKNK